MSAQTPALAPAAGESMSSVADTRAFTLPDAAQILGALWRALDLQFPKRRAQSGRKFLRGDRPGNDETRTGVLRDMASAFVEAGYVYVVDGECEGVRNHDRAVEAIAGSLAHAIAHWDQFVGVRRALARPVDQADVLRYLRLAAIDIALRTAAFDRSFGWRPPPEARGMIVQRCADLGARGRRARVAARVAESARRDAREAVPGQDEGRLVLSPGTAVDREHRGVRRVTPGVRWRAALADVPRVGVCARRALRRARGARRT